jgi:hypothetical protein
MPKSSYSDEEIAAALPACSGRAATAMRPLSRLRQGAQQRGRLNIYGQR